VKKVETVLFSLSLYIYAVSVVSIAYVQKMLCALEHKALGYHVARGRLRGGPRVMAEVSSIWARPDIGQSIPGLGARQVYDGHSGY
jgi:hypothetical protein